MTKLIVLKLAGNLQQQGYNVILEISEEGKPPHVEELGKLPPQTALAARIANHWHDKYHNLVAPYRRVAWLTDNSSQSLDIKQVPRIKPIKISQDSVNDRIEECQKSAGEFQAEFLEWLNSPEFRTIDRCLRMHLSPGEVSRFLIRSEDTCLQKLPWHAWDVFKTLEAEPAFSVSRRQPIQKLVVPRDKQSVKILAILGHSDGIDVEADRQFLEKLAPETTYFLVEPTRQEITDQLWQEHWDIIFFAGHSETEGDTGKIYIRQNEYLTVEELWYGLRKAVENGLQIAIFNSCDGLGLAHQLTNDFQIPHLIVMRELVPDRVAQEFLKYFLSAFKGGRPFHLAVRDARERLQGMEDYFPCASWLPTVYENSLEKALYWQNLIDSQSETVQPAPMLVHPRLTWKTVRRLGAMSLLVTSLMMGVRWSGILEPLELIAYDHLMRSQPTETLDPNILIVEITPEDSEKYGSRISDKQLTEIIDIVEAAKPLAIGLTLQRREQQGTATERTELINRFQANSDLIALCSMNPKTDEVHGAPAEFSTKQKQYQVGYGDVDVDRNWTGETLRRHWLSYQPSLASKNSHCLSGYSFSLLLADKFLKSQGMEATPLEYRSGFTVKTDWSLGSVILKSLPSRFGGYQTVNKNVEQILLNYRNTSKIWNSATKSWLIAPAKTVTLQELLGGEVDKTRMENRIVFIGYKNRFLYEYFPTPLGKQPAVYVHAHALSNLINLALGKKRVQIYALPQLIDALLVFASGLISGAVLIGLNGRYREPILFLFRIVILFGIYQLCRLLWLQGLWMPLIPMMMSVVSAMIIIRSKPFLTKLE